MKTQCSSCRRWFDKKLKKYGSAKCPECYAQMVKKNKEKARAKNKIKSEGNWDWSGTDAWIYW